MSIIIRCLLEFIFIWSGIKVLPMSVLSSVLLSMLSINLCPRKNTDAEGSLTTLWTFLCLQPFNHGKWVWRLSRWFCSQPVRFHSRKKKINNYPIKKYPTKLSSQKLTLLSHFIMCKCGIKWNKWWNSSFLNEGNIQVNFYIYI